MEIIVRQFNVIGLRAEFPKCFTKNVYVYVDSKDSSLCGCWLAKSCGAFGRVRPGT